MYELSTFLLSASSCAEYAKIVKEKSVLRGILKVSQHVIGDVYEQRDTPDILETIEKRIFDLTQMRVGDSLHHIKDILNKRIEEYMEVVDNPEQAEAKKILSHYHGIDDMLGGFKPGELIILAARPSMGKTAFAINVLTNIAVKQQKSVAIFSLEMASEQIVDRILSTIAEVPMYKITKGALDSEDFSQLGDAMALLSESNIYIDDK